MLLKTPEKPERRYFYIIMNNITYAKRLLENYSVNKAARENYPHEMIMINSRLYSSCAENTVVEMIHAKDLLTLRTEKALREIQKTERALGNLSEYEKYKEHSKKDKNVIFGGRLGKYAYFDMDKVILSALESAKEI